MKGSPVSQPTAQLIEQRNALADLQHRWKQAQPTERRQIEHEMSGLVARIAAAPRVSPDGADSAGSPSWGPSPMARSFSARVVDPVLSSALAIVDAAHERQRQEEAYQQLLTRMAGLSRTGCAQYNAQWDARQRALHDQLVNLECRRMGPGTEHDRWLIDRERDQIIRDNPWLVFDATVIKAEACMKFAHQHGPRRVW